MHSTKTTQKLEKILVLNWNVLFTNLEYLELISIYLVENS